LLEISGSTPDGLDDLLQVGERIRASVLRTSMAASRQVGKLTSPDRSRAMSSRMRKVDAAVAISTGNITFQLIDQELLVADGFLDQSPIEIMPTTFPVVVQHGEVAEALFGHQRHAFLQREVGVT
jgi:hypothetical protein